MSIDAELLKLADALKDQFGARLVWLKTPACEVGRRPGADAAVPPTSKTAVWGQP